MRDDWDDYDDPDAVVMFDDVVVRAETPKALLCDIEGTDNWIPKSVISKDSEVKAKGDEGILVIKSWFARKIDLE